LLFIAAFYAPLYENLPPELKRAFMQLSSVDNRHLTQLRLAMAKFS
jgi:hypothetical protein